MTRRVAVGFARLLPLLLIAAAVVVVAATALIAACGSSSAGGSQQPTPALTVSASGSGAPEPTATPSASASAAARSTLRLYFLRDGRLGVAERRVAKTSAIATASLKALFAGPTAEEKTAGLGTAVPTGTRLLSLGIRGGTASVDLSSEFADAGPDAAAEVVYTLTRFPTVKRVAFTVNGEALSLTGTAGSTMKDWRRSDFSDLQPNIFVETPGVGAVISSPFELSGTALVFEGSFQARLVDSSGRRVVNVIMQASTGGPERGIFSREVAFSTSARRGTLIVFDQSMEDGSRQDEVRIPVTFATD